jgi:hypothetical protein
MENVLHILDFVVLLLLVILVPRLLWKELAGGIGSRIQTDCAPQAVRVGRDFFKVCSHGLQ